MPVSEGSLGQGRPKARAYLNGLLRKQKTGNIWINIRDVAKDLNLKTWNFSQVLDDPQFNRIKSTQAPTPETYAKNNGLNPEKFKKWLEKNNVTDDKWYVPQKQKIRGEIPQGTQRQKWLGQFLTSEMRAPLLKKIPEGYITQQQLSKLIYKGKYPETVLFNKLNTSSKNYDPALAELLKKLKPTEKLPPRDTVKGRHITYYQDPSRTFLAKLKNVSKATTLYGTTRGHIETILKNDGLRKLFKNFSAQSELPSWATMKAAFPPGVTENSMATAVMHVAKIMQGKGMKGTQDIKIPYNSLGGTLILRRMNEGQMWGNPWASAVQREALNTIDEKLGRETGTFTKFKTDLKKVLKKAGIPMYEVAQWDKARTKIIKPAVPGFNINEVLQTTCLVPK
jgi:hypothetical protein